MEINNRIKEVRSSLNLSMESFGSRIGVTRSAISRIEGGVVGVTNQNITAICREFNVNKDWLENGEGEMFQELSTEEELAYLTGQVLSNGSARQIKVLKILAKMGPERWRQVEDFIDYIQSELAEEEKQEKGGDN